MSLAARQEDVAPRAFPVLVVWSAARYRAIDLLATPRGRRCAVALLLGLTATLYTAGLSVSGWGNSYYAAAAQAGAESWRATLFGGLDPSGAVSVDKPPAALWLMDLAVRLFGLSSWTVLLPQAACGVAAAALLYAAVRRQALALADDRHAGRRARSGAAAATADRTAQAQASATGLLAAAALALTPVATLMARYDNPDELMLLLLVAAAYALTRSVTAIRGEGAWLVLAGVLLGLGFLTKMLQAWLVLPAFLAVALVAGGGVLGRRLLRCLVAGAAMLAAAGWWVLLVELTPAARRPWVGGTRGNSVLELALGYNGLGRLTGQEASGGASDQARGGSVLRLMGAWGPEVSWLLPAALLALAAGWFATRGRGRRDPLRAGLLLWGTWLVLVALALGSLRGIAHGYYTVELAPAVAATVALGGAVLWRRSWSAAGSGRARRLLCLGLVGNALWAGLLMVRNAPWPFAVVPGVLVLVAAAVALTVLRGRPGPRPPAAGASVAVLGATRPRRRTRAAVLVTAVLGMLLAPALWSLATAASVHRGPNVAAGPGPEAFVEPRGVSAGSAPGDGFPLALVDQVRVGAPGYRWAAAVVGHRAADLQLASGAPVWALGGYYGNDPDPAMPAAVADTRAGGVHYLVVTPRDVGDPGPAGRAVRAAMGCHPVRFSGPWMVVDLGDPLPEGPCRAGRS